MSFSGWVNKWINQMAHVGWAAFLALVLVHRIWWGPFLVLGFAAIKEGIFDRLTQDKGTKHTGWLDFGFWFAGTLLGWLFR